MELEQQLTALATEMKEFTAKAQQDIQQNGAVATETKTAVDAVRAKMLEMQTQLDAVDARSKSAPNNETQPESIVDLMVKDESYLKAKSKDFMSRDQIKIDMKASPFSSRDATARAFKSIITGTGLGVPSTSTILAPTLHLGDVQLAKQELRIRDVMNVVTMSSGRTFDWIRQTTRTNAASPQVETSPKSESTYLWDAVIGTVKTIAHYTNVSKQALDDVSWLRPAIDNELVYGLKIKEESEILSGDGTGEHLDGIITQATAFNTGLLVAADGWTRLDVLRLAKLQARLAGLATYAPSAFVLNPTDMARIELTKSTTGYYIVGDPRTGAVVKFVWGLPVVESDSIASGTFLVGSFDNGATLVDRMSTTVLISFEHDVNFTSNLATILCEERIGMGVKRPTSFITGSFTTSP